MSHFIKASGIDEVEVVSQQNVEARIHGRHPYIATWRNGSRYQNIYPIEEVPDTDHNYKAAVQKCEEIQAKIMDGTIAWISPDTGAYVSTRADENN